MDFSKIQVGKYYRIATIGQAPFEGMQIDVVARVEPMGSADGRSGLNLKNIHINHNLKYADEWHAHSIEQPFFIPRNDYNKYIVEEITRSENPEYFL